MTFFTSSRSRGRGPREANTRNARRAEQANLLAGLQTILEADEQLLGFARGRIAGGFRGKMAIGPEAFFAPFVNICLTDRRFVLQHIHPENGKPSEILPHSFPLSDILSLQFSDIETFGGDPACRLVIRLTGEHFCRLRMRGALNFNSAQSLAEVFASLTVSRRSATTPTQRICERCSHILDQPYRFCPYCGYGQPQSEGTVAEDLTPSAEQEEAAMPQMVAVQDEEGGFATEIAVEETTEVDATEEEEVEEPDEGGKGSNEHPSREDDRSFDAELSSGMALRSDDSTSSGAERQSDDLSSFDAERIPETSMPRQDEPSSGPPDGWSSDEGRSAEQNRSTGVRPEHEDRDPGDFQP